MPRWLPSPISFLCGALLLLATMLYGSFAMLVVPHLGELLYTQPRLAMLGFLGLALSPVLGITIAHHLGSGTLASFEKLTASKRRGLLPDAEAWAAGSYGWLVMIGTSILVNLVSLVLSPPELEPEMLSISGLVSALNVAHLVSVRTGLWIGIASGFYELQRRGRRA